jgi:predicted acylesterase/phospholipase RssA
MTLHEDHSILDSDTNFPCQLPKQSQSCHSSDSLEQSENKSGIIHSYNTSPLPLSHCEELIGSFRKRSATFVENTNNDDEMLGMEKESESEKVSLYKRKTRGNKIHKKEFRNVNSTSQTEEWSLSNIQNNFAHHGAKSYPNSKKSYLISESRKRDDKIILSLHGGGSRGYVAHSILKELRKGLKLNPDEILPVDMIVGVSVGALIGGVEAFGKTETLDFKKMSKAFFVPNEEYCLWSCTKKLMDNIPIINWLSRPLSFINRIFNIKNAIGKIPVINSLCLGSIPLGGGYLFPKYSSKAKLCAITNIFGDMTLGDLKIDFRVPVADTQNNELRIIDSGSYPDIMMRDVIQATTAAPTFFNPHKFLIRDALTEFADGGIIDNNPSDIALCHAKMKFPDSNIKIISIGNGEASTNAASNSWMSRDIIFYGKTLPTYMMATSSNKTSNVMSIISKSDPRLEYIEILPTFDETLIKMDQTNDIFFGRVSNSALKLCRSTFSYAYNRAERLLQNAKNGTVEEYQL